MKADRFFRHISGRSPFSKVHPEVAAFFKDYLSNEKVINFDGRFVVNVQFPPYPSRAFDNFVRHFSLLGEVRERRLFSVALGVTNRCNYNCWHCYNAGRSQQDMPLPTFKKVIGELQEFQVVHVTLTGGEPLLREDLEEIVGTFDERTFLTMNTTGDGLTQERARALFDSGLFALGVSLDSTDPDKHDRLRGRKGAFQTALDALQLSSQSGLYPYIISVATHDFLQPDHFWQFMRFASDSGALEVHLLEPTATGRLMGRSDVLLKQADRQLILEYQKRVAQADDLPILSTFLYLESPDAFGCGAGLTHMYIDGSGEVCPCNLVPLSFGNATREPLQSILERMGQHFCRPRPGCVGRILTKHIDSRELPTSTEESVEICSKYLPGDHPLPRFFQIRAEAQGEVGKEELQSAYDRIHEYYDEFWLKEAGKPIEDLIDKLSFAEVKSILEAGCGTGFATVLLADMLAKSGNVIAVDLSEGMLAEARERARSRGLGNIRFVADDALEVLSSGGPFDIIFSSWVLGYIPLKPFFASASQALRKNGQLAFVVHKENSPYEPLQIFGEIVAHDPSILQKRVAFDFPRDMNHVRSELASVGLEVQHLWEGTVVFRYDTPEEILEHLLKSGAGTAFYDAVDPSRRKSAEEQFLKSLVERRGTNVDRGLSAPPPDYEVIHDYIACIARKP